MEPGSETRREAPDESRRERWEERGNWPLTVTALLFLGVYAWPILQPGLDDRWVLLCRVVGGVAWLVFAVDYLVRLRLAGDRKAFVRGHVFDLLVVVLPMLRPLRLLQVVTLLSVLNRRAGSSLRGRVATYVGGVNVLVVFVAALTALDAERDADGATITSFGDAVWWAVTTVTTVGYGDTYPVTTTGRFVSAGLMLAGIALLGVVAAGLASWLVERVTEVDHEAEGVEEGALRHDVQALAREVRALRAELDRDRPTGGG